MSGTVSSSRKFSAADVFKYLDVLGPENVPIWNQLDLINTFCSRCSEIDWLPVQTYVSIADGYSFYPKIPLYQNNPKLKDIRLGAHAGCHLCTLVLTCLLTTRYRASIGVDPIGTGLENLDDEFNIRADCEVLPGVSPVCLNIRFEDHERDVLFWLELGLPVEAFEDGDRANIYLENTKTDVMSFKSSAGEIARFWLEDCLRDHQSGPPVRVEQILPTRVIDVCSQSNPFLFESKGSRGSYATLSYCWGRSPVLTTTNATLEARKRTIPLHEMPQTLQDAIWWTRELGLKFLWIDALCIIQDSPSDLEIELTRMAEIYTKSTVTIAATASTAVSEGCSPRRNKLSLAPCSPIQGIVIKPDYGRHKWIHQKGPLESRAWTFQEIQLSERVLRCGGEETTWQCRHCKRREGDPLEMKNHDWESTGTYFGTRALDDVKRLKNLKSAFNLWYQVVGEFIVRNLSFLDDRLPAFSGMATHFAGILERLLLEQTPEDDTTSNGLEYVAGLWKNDLLHGLCWRALDPGQRIPYRAPSWSWAAFDAQITYDKRSLQVEEFLTEVLHVDVVVPGLNPYGKVSSAKLTLYGPVAPIPSHTYKDDSEIGPWKWHWPLITWDYDEGHVLGCVCLRLQTACCLILAPVGKPGIDGIYQRVGMVKTPEGNESAELKALDGFDWQYKLLTII